MAARKYISAAILAGMMVASTTQTVYAGPVAAMARPLRVAPPNAFISTSRNTLAPFAFIRFCRKNQDDCQAGEGHAIVQMNAQLNRELFSINAQVNRAIRPVNDGDNDDQWAADVTSGDCEDFALTKRRKLISAGWPSRSLRIAVARTAAGEGHAVLVVKTSQGDLVLDNRTSTIRPWNRTDLTWLKIQSEENPRLWLEI